MERPVYNVGRTVHPKNREMKHRSDSENIEKFNWIQGLLTNGKEPIFEILEECPTMDLGKERERFFIKKHAKFCLLNIKKPMKDAVICTRLYAQRKKDFEDLCAREKTEPRFVIDYFIESCVTKQKLPE